MRLYRYSDMQPIFLETQTPLGAGGEARVYAVRNAPRLAAKIYHEPNPERTRKLLAMLANPPEDPAQVTGHLAIAFPNDLLCKTPDRKNVVGFLMPLAEEASPVFHFYNPSTRRQNHPLFNALYLHRTGRNIAAAIRALHARGYVIGDVNESNILVANTALVTLADTDSFQVRDPKTGELFRCRVGKPEFTPPELQGRIFDEIDRLPEQDLFGLAALLFQLLMEGTHPFAGVYQGTGDPPAYETRIQEGCFPYGSRRGLYRPMPSAPAFEALDPSLRELFLRCFEEGHTNPKARPDAQTWQNALAEAETALLVCGKNEQHHYGRHLTACPWCERAKKLGGRDPFPSLESVRQGAHRKAPPRRAAPALPPSQVYRAASYVAAAPPAGAPSSSASAWSYTSPPVGTSAPVLPQNVWALASLSLSVFALLSPYRFLAGALTAFLGVMGLRKAGRLKGEGRGVAAAGLFLGLATCLAGFIFRPTRGVIQEAGRGISALAFSPSGSTLAIATRKSEDGSGKGGSVSLWDSQSETPLGDVGIQFTGDVSSVAFAPTGGKIAMASWGPLEPGHITVAEAGGRALWQKEAHHNGAQAVAFSPDGSLLASGGCREFVRTKQVFSEVTVWEANTGRALRTMEGAGQVFALRFSPDGVHIAAGCGASGSGSTFRNGERGRIEVYHAKTGEMVWSRGAHGTATLAVAFSPDGKTLASGGESNAITLWEAETGKPIRYLSGEGKRVASLVFSPDGKTLYSGGDDRAATVWDATTGKALKRFSYPQGEIRAVALSPKGDVLASGSLDGTIRLERLKP